MYFPKRYVCTLNLFHYKLVEAGIPVEFKGKSKSKAHKVDSDHFKCMGACFSVKLETLIHSQKAKYSLTFYLAVQRFDSRSYLHVT